MKHDALSKRLMALESRINPVDPVADYLGRCSDEELNLMIEVLTAREEGREPALTSEQEKFLADHLERIRNEGFILEELEAVA